jgi:hypothetical protein
VNSLLDRRRRDRDGSFDPSLYRQSLLPRANGVHRLATLRTGSTTKRMSECVQIRPPEISKDLEVRADEPFDGRSVVSRQFKLRAVIQYDGIFALIKWPKFLDPFGIHQGGAVNSHKSG